MYTARLPWYFSTDVSPPHSRRNPAMTWIDRKYFGMTLHHSPHFSSIHVTTLFLHVLCTCDCSLLFPHLVRSETWLCHGELSLATTYSSIILNCYVIYVSFWFATRCSCSRSRWLYHAPWWHRGWNVPGYKPGHWHTFLCFGHTWPRLHRTHGRLSLSSFYSITGTMVINTTAIRPDFFFSNLGTHGPYDSLQDLEPWQSTTIPVHSRDQSIRLPKAVRPGVLLPEAHWRSSSCQSFGGLLASILWYSHSPSRLTISDCSSNAPPQEAPAGTIDSLASQLWARVFGISSNQYPSGTAPPFNVRGHFGNIDFDPWASSSFRDRTSDPDRDNRAWPVGLSTYCDVHYCAAATLPKRAPPCGVCVCAWNVWTDGKVLLCDLLCSHCRGTSSLFFVF